MKNESKIKYIPQNSLIKISQLTRKKIHFAKYCYPPLKLLPDYYERSPKLIGNIIGFSVHLYIPLHCNECHIKINQFCFDIIVFWYKFTKHDAVIGSTCKF